MAVEAFYSLCPQYICCLKSLSSVNSTACCSVLAYSRMIHFVPVLRHSKVASFEDSAAVQHQHIVQYLPVHFCVLPFPPFLNSAEQQKLYSLVVVLVFRLHTTLHMPIKKSRQIFKAMQHCKVSSDILNSEN